MLLSEEIRRSYQQLLKLISKIKSRTQKQIMYLGEKISPNDIIAYHIGWGKLLIGWYEAGIAGVMPQMPGDGFDKWDYKGLAHYFFKMYHYDDGDEQLAVFDQIVETIISFVEKEHQLHNLDKKHAWPWLTLKSGQSWPLSKWVRVNTVAPYKRTYGCLSKARKK